MRLPNLGIFLYAQGGNTKGENLSASKRGGKGSRTKSEKHVGEGKCRYWGESRRFGARAQPREPSLATASFCLNTLSQEACQHPCELESSR